MTAITIRHVPDEVRNELAARAAQRGQSMQEYLLGELERLTSRPSVESTVLEVRRRKRRGTSSLGRDAILAELHADRR